jgi:hypothetical protein
MQPLNIGLTLSDQTDPDPDRVVVVVRSDSVVGEVKKLLTSMAQAPPTD